MKVTLDKVTEAVTEDRLTTAPVTSKASKDGTTVPPAVQIVDGDGVVWALSSQVEHGGNIVLRDRIKFGGAGVKLVYAGGQVYLQNAPGAWFVVVGTSWAQTSAPSKE